GRLSFPRRSHDQRCCKGSRRPDHLLPRRGARFREVPIPLLAETRIGGEYSRYTRPIVTLFITTSTTGRAPGFDALRFAMLLTSSMPSLTFPNTVWCPSR